MSSSLSGALTLSNQEITKLNADFSRAIDTYSEVLSVLKRALAEKDSTVVSATFVREVIDEGYKNTLYSFKYLCIAFDEYYNAIAINPGINSS